MQQSSSHPQQQQQRLKSLYNVMPPSCLHAVLEPTELCGRRLFIVGDIHGCLDEFQELLVEAGVTHDNTMIICCGDLINKGPKNCATLEYIRSLGPSAIRSVRGNHDEKVIYERQCYDKDAATQQQNVPYAWVKDLHSDDVLYLRELPYTISIPSHDAIVVHAGLVPGIPLDRQQPINMTTMRGVVATATGFTATESKAVEPWGTAWPGPEHVFFGHNASRGLQQHRFATGLDTGCVYGRKLTGVMLAAKFDDDSQAITTFYKVKSKMMYRVPDM